MSESAPHPAVGLDDVTHQRVRLGVLVMLAEIPECAFATLRAELQLTDGNLNRHVQVLVDAGLVTLTKGYENNRPRTWVKLTRDGRRALRAELSALEQLTARLKAADLDDPSP
ncbi:DNA-binding MarR family transcriptional regulator [Actinoplanes octamycinicus]|uniref:DNA-binding MarR family transcriptional regulator n=1 Tax=Actinoplanes octamycinicus TaxID=135948 RepID=A0A7W7H1H2_9ACTN|nr:transcriptional regulator [Actinoplanes octamycinicus]MBB4742243.1 DNA-binding MarR family transcriptional regulator [Actinoplanes octamycinicus]GIE59912.1 transcriptional regulator [Actinoplanes octamycinicus]